MKIINHGYELQCYVEDSDKWVTSDYDLENLDMNEAVLNFRYVSKANPGDTYRLVKVVIKEIK